MAMATFLYALGGYLAGSVPFAVVVSRALGLPDPRTYGSGNIGATNVLRSGNRLAALLTLAGDAAKGWAAVLVARALDWRVGVAVIVVWLTIAVVSRYSSLASITAALFAPVAAWYFLGAGALFA